MNGIGKLRKTEVGAVKQDGFAGWMVIAMLSGAFCVASQLPLRAIYNPLTVVGQIATPASCVHGCTNDPACKANTHIHYALADARPRPRTPVATLLPSTASIFLAANPGPTFPSTDGREMPSRAIYLVTARLRL